MSLKALDMIVGEFGKDNPLSVQARIESARIALKASRQSMAVDLAEEAMALATLAGGADPV